MVDLFLTNYYSSSYFIRNNPVKDIFRGDMEWWIFFFQITLGLPVKENIIKYLDIRW